MIHVPLTKTGDHYLESGPSYSKFVFKSILSDNFLSLLFLELPIINCRQKELKLKCFFKFSNLNSNLALTLGYLNPVLNNSVLESTAWDPDLDSLFTG